MIFPSRTVASAPRPPAPNISNHFLLITSHIYCPFLMSGGRDAETTVLLEDTLSSAGGRDTEATVLLGGHIRLDKNKYSQLYIIMFAMLCIACGFLNINVH